MPQEGFKRYRFTFLSADVQGYTRLIGEGGDAYIRTLKPHKKWMSAITEKLQTSVLNSPEDDLLTEFLSVLDSARFAVEVQENSRLEMLICRITKGSDFVSAEILGNQIKRRLSSKEAGSIFHLASKGH